ncbi:uncharacterized protein [Fopius arisanus]|uniref:Uncharacterized protein isoform X2 n=1 Tax=Fopius arisanus TaxID=64838 RepID=A0A0C9RIC6_9HYME|nr:PREDICTED: uncharacterized protein LOC105272147 isoform X2 [Fopius arisanus]
MRFTIIFIISINLLISMDVSKARDWYSKYKVGKLKFNSEKDLGVSHGFYGKSKRIEVKLYSPGRLAKGIDTKGNILRRFCDNDPVKFCWNKSLVVSLMGRCSNHPCNEENRIERQHLLQRDQRQYDAIAVMKYRSLNKDEKVTNDGDERKVKKSQVREIHPNEVTSVAKNQEVNENDKRMQKTDTLESTLSDKKASSNILQGKKRRSKRDTVNQDERATDNNTKINDPKEDNSKEFVEKLSNVFLYFGDYIVAIMLKNIKVQLREEDMAEAYENKMAELTVEHEMTSMEAAKMVGRKVEEAFGESFQLKIKNYLKWLVDNIELS